jgi:hypothetical protein
MRITPRMVSVTTSLQLLSPGKAAFAPESATVALSLRAAHVRGVS